MNHSIKIERLSRSLFLQNFLSNSWNFSFEYFPQKVHLFLFVNNLVQHKRNVFKATLTLVKKEL